VKLLEDLKQKYPIKNIPPYGECIVVPGPDFDTDFEVELGDEGYSCINTDLDGKPITLVRLKKSVAEEGEKTVYSPPTAIKASPFQKWSSEEDEVLVKLWNERVLIEKMTPSFPGRTEAAIRLRIQRLEKYGKIKKRAGRPKGLTSSVRRWSDQEEQLLIELWNKGTKVPGMLAQFPGRTRNSVAMRIDILQKSGAIEPRWKAGEGIHHKPDLSTHESRARAKLHEVPMETKDEVVELLKQVLEAVKPKEELVCFKSYCLSCRDSRTVEDGNVWKACPVCGGPLIVWNVETKEAPS